jgi:hypothetical protein
MRVLRGTAYALWIDSLMIRQFFYFPMRYIVLIVCALWEEFLQCNLRFGVSLLCESVGCSTTLLVVRGEWVPSSSMIRGYSSVCRGYLANRAARTLARTTGGAPTIERALNYFPLVVPFLASALGDGNCWMNSTNELIQCNEKLEVQ